MHNGISLSHKNQNPIIWSRMPGIEDIMLSETQKDKDASFQSYMTVASIF